MSPNFGMLLYKGIRGSYIVTIGQCDSKTSINNLFYFYTFIVDTLGLACLPGRKFWAEHYFIVSVGGDIICA